MRSDTAAAPAPDEKSGTIAGRATFLLAAFGLPAWSLVCSTGSEPSVRAQTAPRFRSGSIWDQP